MVLKNGITEEEVRKYFKDDNQPMYKILNKDVLFSVKQHLIYASKLLGDNKYSISTFEDDLKFLVKLITKPNRNAPHLSANYAISKSFNHYMVVCKIRERLLWAMLEPDNQTKWFESIQRFVKEI